MPTLTELAEQALVNAKRLDAYTASKGLPSASLDDDTLTGSQLPPELQLARDELADSAQIMKRIALGPLRSLIEILYSVSNFRLGTC